MKLTMFKSKLHQLKVTEADLMYEGSITIDEELLEAAGILPYEKVQIVNITNGSRLETYTIAGERGSRVCCMNGAAARLTQVGDCIIVISYAEMTPKQATEHTPKVVVVDKDNNPKQAMNGSIPAQKFSLKSGSVNPEADITSG